MATSNFLGLFGRGKSAKRKAGDAPVKDDDETATAQAAEGEEGEEEDEDTTDPANPSARATDPEEEEAEDDPEEDDGPVPTDKKEATAYRRGMAAGIAKERARTAKVMSAPETAGREKTAAMLLAAGSTPAAGIVAALASVPKTGAGHLDAAMRQLGNPATGPGFASQPGAGPSLADKQRARQEEQAARRDARR